MSAEARATAIELPHGVRLAVEAAGAGPAVVLLHGIGGHRGQWRQQLRALSDRFGVIAWDARNYGDSHGPRVERFEAFAGDLFALLDALGLGRVIAVGHSMGGRILIEAALARPGRFAGLVLSGAQPAYLEHMTPEGRAAYVEKRTGMFAGGVVRPETAARVAAEVLPPDAPEALRAELAAGFARLRPEGYLAALEASAGWSRVAGLGRLRMPVAVLGGALDTVCPPAECHRLAAALGQGPATILEGVGHMAQIEAPEAVTSFVRAFAADHGAGADRFDAGLLEART